MDAPEFSWSVGLVFHLCVGVMLISTIGSGYADKSGVSSYSPGTAIDAVGATGATAKQADVMLTEVASVIASLSSGNSGNSSNVQPAPTYTATGLLDGNNPVSTGTSSNPPASVNADGSNAESVLQQAVDKEIVATLSAKAVVAGVYNGMGILESLPFSRVTDLGSLLRYNPQLSSILVGNSYNQGIIESLNIIA